MRVSTKPATPSDLAPRSRLMLRSTLLYLSNQPRVFRFVREQRARKEVRSDDSSPAKHSTTRSPRYATLNAKGITASLDLLGESVTNEREARAAERSTSRILDRIHEQRLDANVSRQAHRDGPRHLRGAVRLDHARRARSRAGSTTRSCASTWSRAPTPSARFGCSRSGCIRRTRTTSASCCRAICIARGPTSSAPIKLQVPRASLQGRVQGAGVGRVSREDATSTRTTSSACTRCSSKGNYPGIATHDPAIIAEAKRFVAEKGYRPIAVRVPDAVRRAPRPAGTARARRLSHARLRSVRHAVVSVPHAPPRRASGERRVHHRQRHARDGRRQEAT